MKKLFTSILVFLLSTSAFASDIFVVIRTGEFCRENLIGKILKSPRFKDLNNLTVDVWTSEKATDASTEGYNGSVWKTKALAHDKNEVGYRIEFNYKIQELEHRRVCSLADAGIVIIDLRNNSVIFSLN